MKKKLISCLIFVTFTIAIMLPACAQVLDTQKSTASQPETAPEQVEVTTISGDVQVLLKNTDEYTPAEEGMKLEAGDKIKTGKNGTAEVSFNADDTNFVRLSENSTSELLLQKEEKVELTEGEIFSSISKLAQDSAFEIRTPTAVSGARGTDWITKVSGEETEIEAIDQVPYVRHYRQEGVLSQDRVLIPAGQMTSVGKFKPPLAPRPMLQERRQKFQGIKQQARMHMQQAFEKRRQRQPFNRDQFKQRMQERREERRQKQGSPNKPLIGNEQKGPGQEKMQNRTNAQEENKFKPLTSSEGERKLSPEKQKPMSFPGAQDLQEDMEKPLEQQQQKEQQKQQQTQQQNKQQKQEQFEQKKDQKQQQQQKMQNNMRRPMGMGGQGFRR